MSNLLTKQKFYRHHITKLLKVPSNPNRPTKLLEISFACDVLMSSARNSVGEKEAAIEELRQKLVMLNENSNTQVT